MLQGIILLLSYILNTRTNVKFIDDATGDRNALLERVLRWFGPCFKR